MLKKFDIKKISLILIIVTVISFIGAGISAKLGGLTRDISMNDVDIERVFDADQVESIDVTTVSKNITLYKSSGSEVKLHLHGQSNIDNEIMEFTSEIREDKLVVEVKRKEMISIGFSFIEDVKLDIYVPSNFYKNINLKSTSGEITVEEINVDRLEMKTVSGNIDGNNLYTDFSNLETTSGDMMLRDFKGEVKVKTISGNLFIDYKELTGKAKINTTSGDIELKIPEGSALTSIFDSVSGDFNSNIALTRMGNVSSYGDDGSEIRVKTVSGNYTLYKK